MSSYRLLEVIISKDLRWNRHFDHIIAKASKKLLRLDY